MLRYTSILYLQTDYLFDAGSSPIDPENNAIPPLWWLWDNALRCAAILLELDTPIRHDHYASSNYTIDASTGLTFRCQSEPWSMQFRRYCLTWGTSYRNRASHLHQVDWPPHGWLIDLLWYHFCLVLIRKSCRLFLRAFKNGDCSQWLYRHKLQAFDFKCKSTTHKV